MSPPPGRPGRSIRHAFHGGAVSGPRPGLIREWCGGARRSHRGFSAATPLARHSKRNSQPSLRETLPYVPPGETRHRIEAALYIPAAAFDEALRASGPAGPRYRAVLPVVRRTKPLRLQRGHVAYRRRDWIGTPRAQSWATSLRCPLRGSRGASLFDGDSSRCEGTGLSARV